MRYHVNYDVKAMTVYSCNGKAFETEFEAILYGLDLQLKEVLGREMYPIPPSLIDQPIRIAKMLIDHAIRVNIAHINAGQEIKFIIPYKYMVDWDINKASLKPRTEPEDCEEL